MKIYLLDKCYENEIKKEYVVRMWTTNKLEPTTGYATWFQKLHQNMFDFF